jgi:internalin A
VNRILQRENYSVLLLVLSVAILNVHSSFAQTNTVTISSSTNHSTNAADSLPFPEVVRNAWTRLGNEIGWLSRDRYGRLMFRATRMDASDLPAIRVTGWLAGVAGQNPIPEIPFGLDLTKLALNVDHVKAFAWMKEVRALNLSGTNVSAEVLREIAGGARHSVRAGTEPSNNGAQGTDAPYLSNLQQLDLSDCSLTDAALKELAGMSQLQSLALGHNTGLTDDGVGALTGLQQLQVLDLNHTGLTDDGLKALAALRGLQTLNLFATKVTDAGLDALAPLTSLRVLNIGSIKRMTDPGLKAVGQLKQLELIDLDYAKVTDAGLRDLAGLTHLQTLYLPSTRVTGTGFKDLEGLKELRTIVLAGCPVTDETVKGLLGLKQLQNLQLSRTQITDAGLKELAGALPGLEVKR